MTGRITILPESMLQRLHARRIAGETTARLAHEVGVSYTTLKRAFTAVGLFLRRKATTATAGRPRPIMRRKQPGTFWTPERVAEAHAAHMAGESLTRVAMRHGRSLASLSLALDRAGLERRVKRGPVPGSGTAVHRLEIAPHECVTLDGVCVVCDKVPTLTIIAERRA